MSNEALSALKDDELLNILYFQVTDLWKRFCEKHVELFNYTCDEYSLLLKNDLESVDEKVHQKQLVIAEIYGLDQVRQNLIVKINDVLSQYAGTPAVTNVTELLQVMQGFEEELKQAHLFRFNKLLVDIIEKIQAQNKKNQLFINKALLSLREIRQEATGQKNYSTYTASGAVAGAGLYAKKME